MSRDKEITQWLVEGGELFKQSFTLGNFDHQRIAKSPDMELLKGVHRELTLGELGRVHIDSYAATCRPLRMFARIYHVGTGHFAWYRVTEAAPSSPEKAAVKKSPLEGAA